MPREEGRQSFDSAARKKKNKSGSLYKFSPQPKLSRTMRTSQQFSQDNNCTFSQMMVQRYDSLVGMATKHRLGAGKAALNNPLLKNAKLAGVLSECGIDLEHPVLPVEVAARRAERITREKKNMTPEQQLAVAQRLVEIYGYVFLCLTIFLDVPFGTKVVFYFPFRVCHLYSNI